MPRPLGFWVGLIFVLGLIVGQTARAAEPLPPVDSFRDRFEFRFGIGAHGVGSVESGAVAVNPELVFPQLRLVDPQWEFLVPRLHAGGMFNFSGRTNYGYLGLLWTIGLTDRFFIEGFLGGALHDGVLTGDLRNHKAALGCRALIHSGGSIGYRFAPQWTVMFTFDHLSNGNAVFDACSRNQGLNQYLLRVGYSF